MHMYSTRLDRHSRSMERKLLMLFLIGCYCHVTFAVDGYMTYLKKYGYLPQNRAKFDDKEEKAAIKNFQRMVNLRTTGLLDKDTLTRMAMPRCGVEDMIGSAVMGSGLDKTAITSKFMPTRTKRYALAGTKWKKTDLTFRFLGYTNDMNHNQQRDAVYKAFKRYSAITPLTFTEVTNGEADIYIDFVTRIHSDGPLAAFDGPGGTLAHAYFPEHGDVHFDDDERFTRFRDDGINLDFTAVHEVGHSLGLSHSNNDEAIMYPIYLGYVPNLRLARDDIIGIQALYGVNEASDSSSDEDDDNEFDEEDENDVDDDNDVIPVIPPLDPGAPDACTSDFDAVFTDTNRETFAIKGRYIWKLGDSGVADGYPVRLKDEYYGLPGNINTGFTSHWTGRTYFFKGDRIWRFEGHKLESGYPINIKGTGLPRNPDAAFVWSGDGKIYILKGSRYYIWNEYDEKVIPGGVRPIRKHWKGVPNKVDAAFSWKDGNTYFFKGDKYWRLNDMEMRVEKGYPKSKSEDWLNCM